MTKTLFSNSGRHKGRFASKRRLSVLKNLVRATEEKFQEKQIDTEEEGIEPPKKTVTRSKQFSKDLLFKSDLLPSLNQATGKKSEMINKQIWFPGPLSLNNMVGKKGSGLSSVFNIQCSKCGKINNVHTSNHHRTGGRGPKASDINSRAVLGSLPIGVRKKSGKVAKTHDCRKNHVGSSKSMERDVAVELWTNALDSGTQFSTYVGDDDSTTIADILNKVPYNVEKWSDTIHTKRSLATRLFNLKDRFKIQNCSTLSNKVINYYAKCFSYVVAQNAGNPELLKSGINSIVPHSFGEHSLCDKSWCGFQKCPERYKHTGLPNGKSLYGEPLKNALTNIFSEYATDIVVKKLSPCANSQRNESLNNTIATKNPKTRYYGGSGCNDFRVACGVAQRNLGYGYVSTVLEVLNIEPCCFCTSHEDLMDKKVLSDRTRKATKKFKYRRNQLWGQRSNQNSQKEAKEGKTYETAVALNLDTSVNQPTPRTCTHIEHLLENISDNKLHEYEKLVPSYYAQPDLPPGKMQNSVSSPPFKKIMCFRSTFYRQEM
ncbi:uncharacterized protein [Acropora muricata]|uniref:uncharacterized protein n=1 Tax=Acropora muricata TaxID=159855 RepID=UPI0034E453B6